MPSFDLLIPVRSIRKRAGCFEWPEQASLIGARLEDRLGLEEIASEAKQRFGSRCRITYAAGTSGTVTLARDPHMTEEEGYRLSVSPAGIRIEARTDAGTYYGAQTLKELLRIHGRTLPCCRIDDSPAFRRRGIYFDCSRGKVPTLETLMGLVRHLASLKINELQLYIENVFSFTRHPRIGRGFSPLSAEDLLELQACCERYHIAFVPSLASFGHMERILTLPEYSGLGENPGYRDLPGGTTLCPTDPRSIRLVGDLYDEFLPLFKSVEFNACCDETFGLGEGRSAAEAKRRGAPRLYLEFILQLHGLCEKHGKRMNIWADIVLNHPEYIKELPGDIVLLNWEYDPEGANIAKSATIEKAGLPYIACPGVHGWMAHGTRMEYSMRNIRKFTAAAKRHGATGILNTDWGDFGHRNPLGPSLHGYAYGAAHAWSGGGAKVADARFTENFCYHVFGESNPRLAKQLRALGAVQEKAGQRIYWSVGESLQEPVQLLKGIPRIAPTWFSQAPDTIGAASKEGCEEALASLKGFSWDGFGQSLRDPFLCRAFDDFSIATELDRVALTRVLLGKRIRAGETVGRKQLQDLEALTRQAKAHLQTNWLTRNRPSRLRDSLRLFDNALTELRHLRDGL